ncbi:hypothetical protein O181_082521 [Austropuccinia psidii MF-1]|uniref:CHCH domain-containing protein n=1 Tax=Austropuccinia psidii MF-1 TaxID=1389203 RepID=A0A9Q3FM93_9BASI|nr:hypothetical protein [Austropuccinia psidii MF-1]
MGGKNGAQPTDQQSVISRGACVLTFVNKYACVVLKPSSSEDGRSAIMTTYRPPHYGNTHDPFVDPTPMPNDIPKVDELGVSSAPLKSASFFLGSFCKAYSEDFMLCKAEDANPEHCLKEGRRLTRCAQDAISKIKATCLEEFTAHWKCLDFNNHGFEYCRKPERVLNACLYEKLQFKKEIPGTPNGQVPIHEKKNPIYGPIQK